MQLRTLHFIILMLFSCSGWLFSQAIDIEWEKTYGGSTRELLGDFAKTSDGGYILVGASNAVDGNTDPDIIKNFNYWIIKTDSEGDVEWERMRSEERRVGKEGKYRSETSEK